MKKTTFCQLLCLALIGIALGCRLSGAQSAEFNVTLQAVDDEGKPVPGASLGFSWGHLGDSSSDTGSRRLEADTQGQAVFRGRTRFAEFAYGATKGNYYPTRGVTGLFTPGAPGQWEPWGKPVSVLIRPIKHPVPMHAKRVACIIPSKDVWIGYDLEKGDWMPPYGKGRTVDFEFFYEGNVEDNLNYDGRLFLRLPGQGNGIQAVEQDPALRSEFRIAYEAPLDGYGSTWTWRNARTTPKQAGATSTFVDEQFLGRNFIFRVRAIVDATGRVVRANYGKIYSPFILDPRGENDRGYCHFVYYYNPDGSRNLEFDPKRNLLDGLSPEEKPQAP